MTALNDTAIKACDEYIRAARDVLEKIKYLTPDDRMRLDGGINYLEFEYFESSTS